MVNVSTFMIDKPGTQNCYNVHTILSKIYKLVASKSLGRDVSIRSRFGLLPKHCLHKGYKASFMPIQRWHKRGKC